jgi:hypothetical protein
VKRIGRRLLPILAGALALAACTERPEPVPPEQIEAGYQLLFNDSLVGNALFSLSIDADGGYRIEAFTAPAGKIAGQVGNEVLELSTGTLDSETVRPQRFEHSVMQDDALTRVRLEFDWEARQLRVSNATAVQTLALLPQTLDRLSYLVAAGRLVDAEPGALQELRLATLEATEQVVLQVIGRKSTTVPYGTFEATGIRRAALEGDTEREIWFADGLGPLPIRLMRRSDGNAIEMQLESLSRSAGQPVPD